MSFMRQMLGRVTSNQRREFGIVGMDCSEPSTRRSRREGQETAGPRSNPVFPESAITQKCRLTLPPSCGVDNPNPDDLLAPRGSNFSACIPMIGEWAIARSRADALPDSGLSGGNFTNLQVFTCGNDVPRGYQWTFAGIIINGQDLQNANRDDAGGIATAGNVSGWNMGTEKIFAGQTVWIGRPAMVTTADGRTVPRWKIPGAPADKAYLSTRPLRWNTVDSALVEIKAYLIEHYKQHPNQAFVNETTLASDMNIQCGVRDEMPIFVYAVVTAHQLRISDLVRRMFPVRDDAQVDARALAGELTVALNALLAYLQKTESAHQRFVQTFDSAVGGPEPLYNPRGIMRKVPLLNPTQQQDLLKWQAGAMERFLDLQPKAEAAKEIATGRMHDFLRGRIMGMALSDSQPGAQLDLCLGLNRG